MSGSDLARMGWLALAYAVTGKLGLLLAIPTGYATAVWPPSGIALAALLIWGRRLWPGVLLGSFVLNLGNTAFTVGVDIDAVWVSTGIASGAALQALLSATLLYRLAPVDQRLLGSRDVITVLSIGGPACCIISASIGSASLWFGGNVVLDALPFTWLTWWVGDSIGVVLFLPITLSLFAQPASAWRWRRTRLVPPLLTTVFVVIAMFWYTDRLERERLSAEFQQRAHVVANALDKQLTTYTEALRALGTVASITGSFSESDFRSYVAATLERERGIHALSWNPWVRRHERARFEGGMRARGYEKFSVLQRDANGALVPAGAHAAHVVVQYIEPLGANRKAQGYDVYSDPVRREALDRARRTHSPIATASIRLVQETGTQKGVLIFAPVFEPNLADAGAADREPTLFGFAVGVLRCGSMLASALDGLDMKSMYIQLDDLSAAPRDPLAVGYLSDAGTFSLVDSQAALTSGDPLWRTTYAVGGRVWQLTMSPTPGFLDGNRSWSSYWILAGGVAVSGLFAVFLLIVTGRSIIEEQHAEALTRVNAALNKEVIERERAQQALQAANAHLAELATTDPLTGICNRRRMQQLGDASDARQRRHGTRYVVMLADIDHFKRINDRHGHDTGDMVLASVARTLGDALRVTDQVGRWGGEEFVVLADGTTLADGVELAERLCTSIRNMKVAGVASVTVSFGVAESDADSNFEDVVNEADRALYAAKAAGRNQVRSSGSESSPGGARDA